MSTTIPFNGLNLSNTIGPFYWGFILSLVLTGINVVQGYLYFRSPSRDKPHTRYIAAFMIMLNLTSSALVSQSLFYYLVPHFGSLLPLNSVTNELSADCLISSIITFISQAYFAVQLYTISKLNRRKWVVVVPMTVLLCAVLTLLGGIGCAAIMVVQKHNVLDNRTLMFNAFFGVAKALGALTDIIATIAMCIMLASSKTGMNGTNEILNTLMQFTMRRGALVTTLQTSLSISFHAAPTRLYWLAFHVNVTKLYANTFFSMLNGREGLAQRGGAVIMNNDLGVGKALKLRANPANLALPLASSGSQDDVEMKLMDHTADAKGIGMTPMPTVTKT